MKVWRRHLQLNLPPESSVFQSTQKASVLVSGELEAGVYSEVIIFGEVAMVKACRATEAVDDQRHRGGTPCRAC